MHLAAIEDQIDSAELLLDGKIAVNVKDNLGNSPLNDAQQKGYKDMEALLRKHGGHENAITRAGGGTSISYFSLTIAVPLCEEEFLALNRRDPPSAVRLESIYVRNRRLCRSRRR